MQAYQIRRTEAIPGFSEEKPGRTVERMKTDLEKRILVCILFAGALLRIYRLGHQSLWVDEILTLSVSDPKPGLTIWDYLKYNIHGPLHSLVVYLFHLVSTSDAWLRLPSALAGIGAVYYFFKWVSVWMGERTALVAAALLAVSPVHVYYSQELRNYSFPLFFALASCFHFQRYLASQRRRDLAYYVIFIAMAALSNFTAAFLFAAHTLIFFLRNGLAKSAIMRWLVVSIAVLIIISPWVYRIYVVIDVSKLVTPVLPGQITETERLRGSTTITPSAVPYGFYTLSTGFTWGPSLRFLHLHPFMKDVFDRYFAYVLLALAAFGSTFIVGSVALARERRDLMETAIYILTPVILIVLLCWQNAKAFNARYILLSLPPYLIVLAKGLEIPRGIPKATLVLLVAAVSFGSLGNYYFNGEYAKENVRAAAEYLERQRTLGDCIIAPRVNEVLGYYMKGDTSIYGLPANPGTPREHIVARIDKLTPPCRDVWYVKARLRRDRFEEIVMSRLAEDFEIRGSKRFEGVEIIHLRRKEGNS